MVFDRSRSSSASASEVRLIGGAGDGEGSGGSGGGAGVDREAEWGSPGRRVWNTGTAERSATPTREWGEGAFGSP